MRKANFWEILRRFMAFIGVQRTIFWHEKVIYTRYTLNFFSKFWQNNHMVTKYLIYLMSIHAKAGFQNGFSTSNFQRPSYSISDNNLKTIARRKKGHSRSRLMKILNWPFPSMNPDAVHLRHVYNHTYLFSLTKRVPLFYQFSKESKK